MQITSPKHTIAAVAVAAAFCAPAAAEAQGGHGHGFGRGPDAQQQQEPQQHDQRSQTRNVIVAGQVVAVDGDVVTVEVRRANHHGRALKGQQVQLDVSAARVRVKDVNGDGQRDAADVAVGDRVLAQVSVPRGAAPDLTQALAARRLIDVGPVPSDS